MKVLQNLVIEPCVIHKNGGYGKITIEDVFVKSSNVGTALLVDEHFGDNPQEYLDIIKGTGFGKPLNFQLMGEGEPFIKDVDHPTWSDVSLPWISVGYETSLDATSDANAI